MNFTAQLLPASWLWGAHGLYAIVVLWAIKQAAWQHLKNAQDTHILLGACLAMTLIWQLTAGVTAGLEFHLLLVTTVTLMFGWPFAVLCTGLAQLGLTLSGYAEWMGFSINALCNAIIPIGVSYLVYWLTFYGLPRHFFIYIYVTTFAGSALAMLASRLVGMGLLLMGESYQFADLGDEPLFIIVMLFPEAFINGLLMTLLVAYRPQWVSSFSDKLYLHGK